jgi:hypothetical protein
MGRMTSADGGPPNKSSAQKVRAAHLEADDRLGLSVNRAQAVLRFFQNVVAQKQIAIARPHESQEPQERGEILVGVCKKVELLAARIGLQAD